MTWWLILWYVFCAINIALVLWFIGMVNTPKFRDSDGDISTEVGYSEDPTGRKVDEKLPEASDHKVEDPHIMYEGH